MGRLNVGGGGKRVEIKMSGFAWSGERTSLATNINSMLSSSHRHIQIRNGYYYKRDVSTVTDGKVYKYKINPDNSLTLEHTLAISSLPAGGYKLSAACLGDDGYIYMLSEARWFKINTETFELIEWGSLNSYSSTGTISGQGILYQIEGEFFFLLVDESQSGIIKYSYGNDLSNKPVISVVSYPQNSGTANQSFRGPFNLVGVIDESNANFRLMTKDGVIKGYVRLEREYYNYSDERNIYSPSNNKIYAPSYTVVRDTNSIPNPKRKNLSAKFDILPDFLT